MTGNAGVYGQHRFSTPPDLEYTGTNCSGSTGSTSRTLTISRETTPDMRVLVNKAPLIRDTEFTVLGKVITFLVKIYNSNVIVVQV